MGPGSLMTVCQWRGQRSTSQVSTDQLLSTVMACTSLVVMGRRYVREMELGGVFVYAGLHLMSMAVMDRS